MIPFGLNNRAMISVVFEQPTPRIDDEKQLHKLFGTDRLSLDTSASVVFEGAITLGSDILFSGDCLLGGGTTVENGCILTNVELGSGNKVRAYSILSNLKLFDEPLFFLCVIIIIDILQSKKTLNKNGHWTFLNFVH